METAMNYLPYKVGRGFCSYPFCLFWFVYTQCIPFAELFFLSVVVKHLNKVSPKNFALFRYSS